jgi:rhodanese-related sulfurtransferase
VESEGALVLDTRAPQIFKDGFIPKSINIWLRNDFAPWLGTLVSDIRQPIVLVCDEGNEEEAVTRMSRVGYDACRGYLKGGFAAWRSAGKEIDTIDSISPETFAERLKAGGPMRVFDLRRPSEWDRGHLAVAEPLPLAEINERMAEFSRKEPNYLHCASGFRSMIAASILKARGYENVVEVARGFSGISKTDAKLAVSAGHAH